MSLLIAFQNLFSKKKKKKIVSFQKEVLLLPSGFSLLRKTY